MRRFSLLCLVFLVGCSSPTEPVPLPPGSVPMDPVPDNYAEWYADVEGCMGAEGDYDAVSWYVVPGVSGWISQYSGQLIAGQHRLPHDIYIAEERMGWESNVKHEIIHDILQGGSKHPVPPFGTCEGVDPGVYG